MKVEFHGVDDAHGPVGVYLTAETDTDLRNLVALRDAVGNGNGMNACLSDFVPPNPMDAGDRVVNGILDIFPDAR